MDCYHGFSLPTAALPGAEKGAMCVWTDLDLPLPGSPWSPQRGFAKRYRVGSVVLELDRPLAGDPRLTGYALDRHEPFRRIRLTARTITGEMSRTVASLHRGQQSGDGFHGFAIALPAPLRVLEGGVTLIDTNRELVLARLRPQSL
jgi:hypothetical protein